MRKDPSLKDLKTRIKSVKNTSPPVYTLEDSGAEELLGNWYEQELSEVSGPLEKERVEYVVRHKNTRGKRYALVKLSQHPKEKWISVKMLNALRNMI